MKRDGRGKRECLKLRMKVDGDMKEKVCMGEVRVRGIEDKRSAKEKRKEKNHRREGVYVVKARGKFEGKTDQNGG